MAEAKEADWDGIADRMKGLLWGMAIGDAVAMPVHWYYNIETLRKDYGDLTGYVEPKPTHPESMLGNSGYNPDPSNPIDILHEKRKYYAGGKRERKIKPAADEHGNILSDDVNTRPHYHVGLKKGENTVNQMALVRIPMRVASAAGSITDETFLKPFEELFVKPGQHNDAYLERYVRLYFENRSRGAPPPKAAHSQRDVWSIGSMGAMLGAGPMSVLTFGDSEESAVDAALHQSHRTHVSEAADFALRTFVPLLRDLIAGKDLRKSVCKAAKGVFLPKVKGRELMEIYRAHNGPGNIPKDKVWAIHMDWEDEPFDVTTLSESKKPDHEIVGMHIDISNICYVEHGYPATLVLAHRYAGRFRDAVVSNAHLGGHSTDRGSAIGALVGASVGFSGLPDDLVRGLLVHDEYAREVDAFVDIAIKLARGPRGAEGAVVVESTVDTSVPAVVKV